MVGAAGLGAVVAAAACVSLVLPWLAARDVAQALRTWRTDPAGAYARLDDARRLNALSERPDLYAGAIAARRGDLERMRQSFGRALERNPASWYAAARAGAARGATGRRPSASARAAGAAVNPREHVLH